VTKAKTGGLPWGGYVRVSDTHGKSEESKSRKDQRAQFAAWASYAGAEVKAIEEDLDVSGGKAVADRGIGKLVGLCEEGRLAGIVTRRVDRMGRDAAEITAMAKRMRECEAALVGLEDGVDSRSESGKLLLTILAGIAENELDRITATWAKFQRSAIERGVHVGSTPRGYSRDGEGRLVPNDEAGSVRNVFSMRADGSSWSAIAEATGIPESTCQKIARCRTYLGEINHQGFETVKGAHESIVTDELFYQANARAGRRVPRNVSTLSSTVLLSGLCRCAGCGYLMQVQVDKRASRPRPFYYCSGKARRIDGKDKPARKCPAPAFAYAPTLDEHVSTVVGDYLSIPSGIIADALEASGRLERCEASVREAQTAYDVILANTRQAARDPEGYDRQCEAAWQDLEAAKLELGEARNASSIIDGLTGGDLAGWHSFDLADKRRVLGHLLERVTVRRGKGALPWRSRIEWNTSVLVTEWKDEAGHEWFRAPEAA
jgi:DNA invertase Pin-like site-specific DNA recombinase